MHIHRTDVWPKQIVRYVREHCRFPQLPRFSSSRLAAADCRSMDLLAWAAPIGSGLGRNSKRKRAAGDWAPASVNQSSAHLKPASLASWAA